MDQKAALTLALVGAAAVAGTALALGVGRPPRPENEGVVAVREETSSPGRGIFTQHQCVVCHGVDGSGTEMGPGLGGVMPLYLEAGGGDLEGAKARLVEYLKSPQGVPVLRRDSTKYPNPMPSAKGLGLDDDKLRQLADFLIHMEPSATAVGGDAKGR